MSPSASLLAIILSLFLLPCSSLPIKPNRHRQLTSNNNNPEIPPCKWYTITQPINHLGLSQTTFEERLCVIDNYVDSSKPTSVFLYVGNESPVDEYVNNTGLMYELAPKHNALLVFAEHRYQGESIPNTKGVENCMSFCTVENALADYGRVVQYITSNGDVEAITSSALPSSDIKNYDLSLFLNSPVIAFGGSYGGMLAAWMRFKYPSSIAGAIAASAPIWGLPLTNPEIDGAAAVLKNGMQGVCADNIKSALVLMTEIGKLEGGMEYLSETFNLCNELKTTEELVKWASSPWFDLAEGDFPFPSTYITFAVGPGMFPLPAWPVSVACDNLDKDFGVKITGSPEDVKFSVEVSETVIVDVDWSVSINRNKFQVSDLPVGVTQLMEGLSAAVGVWCNVSGTLTCNNVNGCGVGSGNPFNNIQTKGTTTAAVKKHEEKPKAQEFSFKNAKKADVSSIGDNICTIDISKDWKNINCWEPMCCNDNMNMPNCLAQGMGRDMFWPPTVPRGTTLESLLGPRDAMNKGCSLPDGLFGYPEYTDSWSHWLDIYFGGLRVSQFSNVVFSNGLLDPWSSAGVLAHPYVEGEKVQKLNEDGNMIALILDKGAHHLDLFFSTEDDPACATEARKVEDEMISMYIQQQRDAKEFKIGEFRGKRSEL